MPDPTPTPTPTPPAPDPEDASEKLLRQLERLVGTAGGEKEALKLLFDENLEQRVRHRETKRKLQEALAAKVPDGAIVLTGDDAKHFAAIQKLSLPLADLPKALEDGTTARTKLGRYERLDVARKAAELAGFRAEAAQILVEQAEKDGLVLSIDAVEETVNGEKVTRQVARVRPAADQAAQPTELAAHAEQHWPLYLPALTAESSAEGRRTTEPPRRAAPASHSGTPTPHPKAADVDTVAEQQRLTGAYAL